MHRACVRYLNVDPFGLNMLERTTKPFKIIAFNQKLIWFDLNGMLL
jgi:hypothetical protein